MAAYKVQASDPLSDDTPSGALVGHVPAGSSFHVSRRGSGSSWSREPVRRGNRLRLKQVLRTPARRAPTGNLPPMRRSLQSCHNRASGRLAHLAGVGPQPDEGYGALHNKDLEWLVHNWLVLTGKCAVLYAGSSSDEDVDHKGWAQDGGLVLGQTTRTKQHVEEKLEKLGVAAPGATRLLFCPQAAVPEQLSRASMSPPGGSTIHLRAPRGPVDARASVLSPFSPCWLRSAAWTVTDGVSGSGSRREPSCWRTERPHLAGLSPAPRRRVQERALRRPSRAEPRAAGVLSPRHSMLKGKTTTV